MISLNEAVVARMSSHGHHFEIMVDPEKGWEIKQDKIDPEEINWDEVVAAKKVYTDASKAKKAGKDILRDAFDTIEFTEIAPRILKEGELQLTTDQRREMQEKKHKEVVNTLARECINPQTDTPHPPKRIERALEEVGFKADPFKSARRQIEEVFDDLRPIIPIKMAQAEIRIKVPPQYASKAYGYLKQFEILNENWLNDGSLQVNIQIPSGVQNEVFDKLNNMTHGDAETKLVRTI